ncbi:flagellar basal body L-ring protein [Anaplasmataceae bacterium AB001_6]|nr:flagellar basal body L-ring protein [Anaplasmataceae bacterium AB001_6]
MNDVKNGGPQLSDINVIVDTEGENEIHNGKRYRYNSLWKENSSVMFQSTRPGKIGDIIKVKIRTNDRAKLENETEQDRTSNDQLPMPNILGTANPLQEAFNTPNALGISSTKSTYGNATIDRKETISTEVGVTVTKVLNNGNLIVEGSQEMLVNTELRRISINGVVRPDDIAMDNTIDASQIAELRVMYGGRGVISDIQRPKIGSQILDILSPF